jgi:hypothetical protein
MKAGITPNRLPRGLTWNFIHSCKVNIGSGTCNFEDYCIFDQGLYFQLLSLPNPKPCKPILDSEQQGFVDRAALVGAINSRSACDWIQ